MSTISRQTFTTADIADFAQFISGMGFSDTDFSVEGVYDFIANSKAKLRLKIKSSQLVLYVMANGTESIILNSALISARLVTTANGSALSIYKQAAEITPSSSQMIILAPAVSTYDKSAADILIVGNGLGSSNNFYAPDMQAFGTVETVPGPIADSLNTVTFKLAGSKTYYIPDGLYVLRNTNVALSTNYYRLILNNVPYETIGYLALKDE